MEKIQRGCSDEARQRPISAQTIKLDLQTKSFAYADNLCVTNQQPTFSAVEASLTNAVNGLHQFIAQNSLKANPAKTQACSFHLKNRC